MFHILLLHYFVVMTVPCTPSSCQNGGTCVERSSGNPMCQCTEQYQGEFCETRTDGKLDCNALRDQIINKTNSVWQFYRKGSMTKPLRHFGPFRLPLQEISFWLKKKMNT